MKPLTFNDLQRAKMATLAQVKNFMAQHPEYKQEMLFDLMMGETIADVMAFYMKRAAESKTAEFFNKYL